MSCTVAFITIAAAVLQPGSCAGSVHAADGGRQGFLHAGIINNASTPLSPSPDSWKSWGFSPAAPDIPFSLVKLGNECRCAFHGSCSCKDTLAFMDCIGRACSSGKCTCPADQYQQSCQAMRGACLDLEFECSNNRVKCSEQANHPWDQDKKGLLEALEEMRMKKCQLKESSEAGWVNADNRIRELEPKIQDALRKLRALGGEPPYMGCGDGSNRTVVKAPVNRSNFSDPDYVESGTVERRVQIPPPATTESASPPAIEKKPMHTSSSKKTCMAFFIVFLIASALRVCCTRHPTLNVIGSIMSFVVIIAAVWYVVSAGLWGQFFGDAASSMDSWCWTLCLFVLVSLFCCICECVNLVIAGLAYSGIAAASSISGMFAKEENKA